MHITRIEPANIIGLAGRRIEELETFLKHTNGLMRPGIPVFDRLVFSSIKADGDHIPKIGYVGKSSHIGDVMQGRFGVDLAKAIRIQDPRFDQAVAGGFARAAQGYRVCEMIEMEVKPPGSVRSIPANYYRYIDRLWIGGTKPVLVNLTLPVLELYQGRQLWPGKEYQRPN